jgi:hypothetical protein
MQLSAKQIFAFFGIDYPILGVDIVPGKEGGGVRGVIKCLFLMIF